MLAMDGRWVARGGGGRLNGGGKMVGRLEASWKVEERIWGYRRRRGCAAREKGQL